MKNLYTNPLHLVCDRWIERERSWKKKKKATVIGNTSQLKSISKGWGWGEPANAGCQASSSSSEKQDRVREEIGLGCLLASLRWQGSPQMGAFTTKGF